MKSKKTRIISIIISLLLLIAALFLGIKYIINEKFVSDYKSEAYSGLNEDALFIMNFPQSYIPYYNSGNAAYQNEEYDKAEEYYLDALKHSPPHRTDDDYECNIRINLALSMLQQLDYNPDSDAAVEKLIEKLMEARNVLTETGCANPDDSNGHNADAEQLKKEIDDLIDKLQTPPESQDNSDDQNNNSGSSGNDNSDEKQNSSQREQEIKDKLEQERKDSYKSMRDYQQFGGFGDEYYGYTGDKW
jgi:tetratricopeptide (TPR) repeat protein